ncbi:hypothetical protein L198_04810 [Cryptococcus wingfieldii CBS 7118]|uniref:Uncharacterized protein n=1 Tax=Cryptococcus wingfieldii CBS 7118 TaxID=1295528 RepID=A0A1E3J1E3_9TREE|nr:hypothetical protein L198_04810 [Cryptococcus wingfieldii CBS 7118]ODN94669.1 hypothetical protein L198_04810 [Cryptococcus wingfieldii CBS 7118]
MSDDVGAPPHLYVTIAGWIALFPLDDLTPTEHTFISNELEEKGIIVIYDSSLNRMLSSTLQSSLSPNAKVVAFEMEMDLKAGRNSTTRSAINPEDRLFTVLSMNFFDRCADAINIGLPAHLHGQCEMCPRSKSGISSWVFMSEGRPLASTKVKLLSVLTTPIGSDNVGGEEPGEVDSVHTRMRLDKLVAACKQEDGLKIILAEREGEKGKPRLTLRVVNQNGSVDPGMTHWAAMISQLWVQLLYYDRGLTTLTLYNVWIPFERDVHVKNLFRMGEPIYRTKPDVPTPPEPLDHPLPPLPVWPSFALLEEILKMEGMKSKNISSAPGGPGYARGQTTKRNHDEVDGAGGACDGTIDASLLMPKNAVAVTLRVSFPDHRSPKARHFFLQGSLDDSYITGCLLSCFTGSPPDSVLPASMSLPVRPTNAELSLAIYLSSGRLWDVYHSVLTGEGLVRKDVIAEVMCPYTYDDGEERSKELFENSEGAIRAHRREATLYSGPLASLQGGVVLAVYGSFDGRMCLGLGVHGCISDWQSKISTASPMPCVSSIAMSNHDTSVHARTAAAPS